MSTTTDNHVPEPLWTVDDVAAYLKVSPELVYKLRRLKRLPAVRVGALFRWRPAVVRSFVENGEG